MPQEMLESIEVRGLHNVADQLARVGQYLARINMQLSETDGEPRYCLDWEMLQEAIYPDDPRSVYSPLIWYAFECTEAASDRDEDWSLLIPEGARIELLRHLRTLLRDLRDSARALSDPSSRSRAMEESLGTLPACWRGRRDWKGALQCISTLYRASQAVRILVHLMHRYCRPVPPKVPSCSKTALLHYEHELSLVRSKKSNRADAINLASVSALHHAGPSHAPSTVSVQLITGSATLWKLSPDSCVDPFYWVLEADFRRRFKHKRARAVALASTISDIYRILARITPYVAKQHLFRDEVNAFMQLLEGLADDQALRELGQLLSSCSQAVANARLQARDVQVATPEFSGIAQLHAIHSQALLLARSLGAERSARALGLSTRAELAPSGVLFWSLMALHDKIILTAQRFHGTVTLTWATPLSLEEFRTKTQEHAIGAGPWSATVRVLRRPGVETMTLPDLAGLLPSVTAASRGNRLAFLRLERDHVTLWYVPGQGRQTEGVHRPTHATISLRTRVDRDADWIGSFHADTAEEWYFPDVINLEVRTLNSLDEVHRDP